MKIIKNILVVMCLFLGTLRAENTSVTNGFVIDTEFLKIFGTVGGAGMGMGILVDEIAALVSDEGCLTISLDTFPSLNPSQIYGKNNSGLAIVTGLSKTWKESLFAAMAIASSARLGRWPKLSLSDTKKIIAIWSAAIFLGSLIVGVTKYCRIVFEPGIENKDALFLAGKERGGPGGAKEYIHGTACLFAVKSAHDSMTPLLLTSSVLCASWVIYKRYQLHQQELLKNQFDNSKNTI
jgi:hypothetical protein